MQLDLYGLWLQMVTAGYGTDALKLKSTLTFFGYVNMYNNFVVIRYTNNVLAIANMISHVHLKTDRLYHFHTIFDSYNDKAEA